MITISLTEFVDFAIKSGPPKLTVVRHVKKRHDEGYDPKTDFYKKVRDGLVDFHRQGQPKAALASIANSIADRNKSRAYPILVDGYKRFLGRKQISWFEPTRRSWSHADLAVNVNPELGLDINGTPHLVKLYFKADPLSKLQLATILHLMQLGLKSRKHVNELAVLDVRRSKLFSATAFDPTLKPLLQGEAASFATMYKAL